MKKNGEVNWNLSKYTKKEIDDYNPLRNFFFEFCLYHVFLLQIVLFWVWIINSVQELRYIFPFLNWTSFDHMKFRIEKQNLRIMNIYKISVLKIVESTKSHWKLWICARQEHEDCGLKYFGKISIAFISTRVSDLRYIQYHPCLRVEFSSNKVPEAWKYSFYSQNRSGKIPRNSCPLGALDWWINSL